MKDTIIVNTFCGVCEHSCGMQLKAQGNDIVEIRGLKDHPYSRGVLCPKAYCFSIMFFSKL